MISAEQATALADKVAVRARAFPEGFMQVFDDYRSAHNAYMDALKADPTQEVGIWRNRENNKYVLSYGNPTKVKGPSSTVEKAFELVKHHHPGEPVAAAITDRVPSSEDFEALMAPRLAQVDKALSGR